MAFEVRYTSAALADFDSILGYIAERNPAAAQRVGAALRQLIAGLADFPDAGSAADYADVRTLAVPRLPYRVFYRRI